MISEEINTYISTVMNSEPKVSSNGVVIPDDSPFKILSEKQLEWMQFKAKQKFLELKEEEEWRKYCQEQNYADTEDRTVPSENPLNSDNLTNKAAEKCMKPVSAEQAVDHKRKTKGPKKPIIVHPNKGRVTRRESTLPVQISHFQKTRIENPFNFPVSGKLNVLKVQKEGSGDRANLENSDGENKGNASLPAVPVRQRTAKAVDLPDLDYDELSRDLGEIPLYPKVSRNIGFSLPYSLRQQRYLAWRAYLPSFSKPIIHRKKIPISSNKNTVGTAVSKRGPAGTTASGKINSKLQNPSTSKTMNFKSQEKVNTKCEKENFREKPKSVLAKGKKLSKVQKDDSKKVVEFVLNEILDEVISRAEHEEEEKRKKLIFGQLNDILHKLNDIESEESAIHRKWETFTVAKPDKEGIFVSLVPSAVLADVPKSSSPVQEKFAQSTVNAIFREALKSSEISTSSVNSETSFAMKAPCPQNSNVGNLLVQDVNVLLQHPTEQNPIPTETGKQTVALAEAIDFLNFKSEREIGVTSESLRRIYNYRKCFRQYLRQSSEISRQHCDFWNVSAETADQILEECLHKVAEELCEIPSSLIVDLYNQEFEHSCGHS